MVEKVLSVPEVHCDHCVSSIEGAVGALAGIEEVKVNLAAKDVTVKFDDARSNVDQIVAAIEEQGYKVGGPGEPGETGLHQIGPKP